MKKIILLASILFILTGCEATYTVELKNDNFTDNLQLYEEKQIFVGRVKSDIGKTQIIDTLFSFEKNNAPLAIKSREFFSTNQTAGYQYKNTFTGEEATPNWPSLVNTCYENINTTLTEDTIEIKTSAKFTCFKTYTELNKVTIRFTSAYPVKNHNADTVDGNTYIWTIENGDAIKPIYIKVDREKMIETEEKKQSNPVLWIIVTTLIAIITFIIFLQRKHAESKKID